jgi:hypothetical protein
MSLISVNWISVKILRLANTSGGEKFNTSVHRTEGIPNYAHFDLCVCVCGGGTVRKTYIGGDSL